jgi:DoxX-like family
MATNVLQVEQRRSQPVDAVSSRRAVWIGRVLSGLAILFLAFDSTVKLLALAPALEGTARLGFPLSTVRPIGILEAFCLVAYAFPPSAVFGAVLLTGYLGGAIATHVRLGDPLFSHVLFPVYVGALLWGGLWLRDRRVRALAARRDR